MVIILLFYILLFGHYHHFYTEIFPYFPDGICMMPHSQCKVMGWSFFHPAIEKGPDIGFEIAPCVGISRRWNRTGYRLAFCNNKFELTGISGVNAQHGYRTFFNFEFDTRTGTVFTMV